jgi:hypothetical protein
VSDDPDYSTYSLSNLRRAERAVDGELFPERRALIRREIRRLEAIECSKIAPAGPRYFSHALSGLVLGQSVFGVYGFVIASHINDQYGAAAAAEAELKAVVIPFVFALLGCALAKLRPIAGLTSPWIVAMLCVGLLLTGLFDLFVYWATTFDFC